MTTNTISIKSGDVTARLVGAPEDAFNIEADPWVAIGRATIDGTYADINRMFGVDAVGKTTSLGPTMIGGRMLVATGWHLNKALGGEALVFCDIVRRQSEIDAERKAHIDFVSKWAADPWRLRPTMRQQACPECGPHGNAGRVLLASTWVACTVCAGGKPGDAFGIVEIESRSYIRPEATCKSGLCTGREEDGWCSDCDRRDAEAEHIRAGLKMADEAMPGVMQGIAVDFGKAMSQKSIVPYSDNDDFAGLATTSIRITET